MFFLVSYIYNALKTHFIKQTKQYFVKLQPEFPRKPDLLSEY